MMKHTERFHSQNALKKHTHPKNNGFQHILLPLWSTVGALTDADFVVRSTTTLVFPRQPL